MINPTSGSLNMQVKITIELTLSTLTKSRKITSKDPKVPKSVA